MTGRYDALIGRYAAKLREVERRFHLLGYAKLLLLAALGVALWLTWREWRDWRSLAPAPVAAALFAALAALWIWHIRVHGELRHCRAVLDAAGRYLERMAGRWTSFADDGGEFAAAGHAYCADLDIVGASSLFQMLNVAHTHHGRRRFAADLLDARYDAAQVAERQRAVAELAEDVEFAVLLECQTAQTGGDAAVLPLVEALGEPARPLSPAVAGLLLWVPPLVTAFFAAATLVGGAGMRMIAGVLCVAQGVFWDGGHARTGRALSAVLGAPHIFAHYAGAMKLAGGREYASPLLAGIGRSLSGGEHSAVAAMDRLDTIVAGAQLKHSGVLYFLANVFLLWDYRCVVRLEQWRARYGAKCGKWFEELGELESLLSLSVLGNVCAGTCFPQIAREAGLLEAAELGHPLLPDGARVCNDVDLRGGLLIISGSNMSGKTTFLRTVGVSLVLANAGGRVCAASMRCSRFHLRTSLRVADNLDEGVSSFYAELRQVAAIIRDARERGDLFFLIDELFRGTNSEDRLFGARAVIGELARGPAVGMVTTHDLSLCDLERTLPAVRNCSFSEEYRGDEMLFSYKMQAGRARSTNARYLMRQIGILE